MTRHDETDSSRWVDEPREKTNVGFMVLTYNEETNIRASLESVKWAQEVFILDSFSTDRTREICEEYAVERGGNLRFFEHKFENYGAQRNYAFTQLPWTADWIFVLDADEIMTAELARDVAAATSDPSNPVAGYFIPRRFIFFGRWIRHATAYPFWDMRLVRRDKAHYERTVNEKLLVDGPQARMKHDFLHDNRKGIADWLAKHNRYSTFEAREYFKVLYGADATKAGLRDILGDRQARRKWLKRLFVRLPCRTLVRFFYMYVWRRGFLDGRPGFIYAVLRSTHEFHITAKIRELEWEAREKARSAP